MTVTAERLKSFLVELPYGDRAELAHFLIGTLDSDVAPPGAQTDESLDDTLNRRLQELLDGTADLVPAFEAIDRLRKKLA